MNAKERVMAVINHQKPDRMPCFGANSTVTYEQMEKVGAFWPEGHVDAETMAKQALAAYTVLGFDAVRLPFCQTFEAVALGCKRKPGKAREGWERISRHRTSAPLHTGRYPGIPRRLSLPGIAYRNCSKPSKF